MSQTSPHTSLPLSSTDGQAVSPEDVLGYWLGDGVTLGWPSQDLNKRWFGGGPALDEEITARFGARVADAVQGGLTDWETPPLHRLALVILLDQFTRNVFRGDPRAFEGDDRSQKLVQRTLDSQDDLLLPWVGRVFLYMPLMHAEDLALQRQCVACFTQLLVQAPEALKKGLQGNLDFARQHLEIIERFGRFPHRNAAMGRSSTAEEAEFLVKGPRFGQ